MTAKNSYIYIKTGLIIYACILFSLSIFIPVFVKSIGDEGKIGLSFLRDCSFAWVSAIFLYFFGKDFLIFMKNRNILGTNLSGSNIFEKGENNHGKTNY